MTDASAALTPLKIVACTEADDGTISQQDGPGTSISLLINPSQMKHERRTCFVQRKPMGDTGSGRKFSHMQPGKLSFSPVFDGSGVVPRPKDSTMPVEVEDQLQSLSKVIYAYKGVVHEPSIVQIIWGKLLFQGRLTSFSVDYTLFRPSGSPLRATAALAFDSYTSNKQAELEAGTSSPDLSHLVLVRDGDTLPLLCEKIYGDGRYYTAVARYNGLRQFRSLTPGMELHFPPLE
ncbi:peptidoglycan-binding protein [Cupriavidus sp. SW-Y-13]|uniref:CIS tube protein n=1 Tax=Cupriavidus sp. SW-Y-13 TaxID=2653854 RepID=UPI001365C422|nr:peptidoglycan-binding protein [Cupriavidus sp. SW-Y-13]MWL89300.1 peptidoglycan-binding protein [Cupriavidus sp. SW-Y-13]